MRTRSSMGLDVAFYWAVLVMLAIGAVGSLALVAFGIRHRRDA